MECVYRLLPTANQYNWGKLGESSLVYRLFKRHLSRNIDGSKNLDPDGPFSELWLGTHNSSPSTLLPHDSTDVTCRSKAETTEDAKPSDLGPSSRDKLPLSELLSDMYFKIRGVRGKELRILFKVLSIDKPLSLQMHPDDESAADLFSRRHPAIVDSSAKPEMCLALTKFKALCGFREPGEIEKFAKKHPEFAKAVGSECLSDTSDPKSFYLKLLRRFFSGPDFQDLVNTFATRLRGSNFLEFAEECFLTLCDNHPSDPCAFFAFILNCVELRPGEALFLAPNTMHSYISGDCVEVMKNSDNVIRCGLTSKFRDVDLCLSLVENRFQGRKLEEFYVKGSRMGNFSLKYEPNDSSCNFTVLAVSVPPRQEERLSLFTHAHLCIVLSSNPEASLALERKSEGCSSGVCRVSRVDTGDCFLFAPDTHLQVLNNHATDTLTLYLSAER